MGVSFLVISACEKRIDITAENKAIVERLVELWNTGDLSIADKLFATDFVNHDPGRPNVTDLESYKGWVVENHTAFPDFHVEVHDMIAENNKVASRWTVSGTHKGEFLNIPPSGNKVTITGIEISRLANGKIVEVWWSYDRLGMMQQLGVIPPMPDTPLPALNRNPEDYPWGPSSEVTGDPGDPETNKALVLRQELEGWKQGNVEVALEAIAPTFVNHDPIWPRVTDYESYKQWVESELDGPLNITVEDLIVEGDKVVERVTVDIGGEIMESVMIIHRFADGKIVERWWSKDVLGLLQQLGIIPPPEQGGEIEGSFPAIKEIGAGLKPAPTRKRMIGETISHLPCGIMTVKPSFNYHFLYVCYRLLKTLKRLSHGVNPLKNCSDAKVEIIYDW